MHRGHERWTMSSGGWIGARPSRGVIGVLVGLGVFYVAYALFGVPEFFHRHLALTPRRALGPEPWQLLTAGLVHFRLGALISTALAIWFFGTPLEEQRGGRVLAAILVGATVAGSLVSAALGRWLAPDAVLAGAAPASMACIASFGTVYGRMPLSLFGMAQMRASTCALLFLGISAVMYLLDRDLLGGAGAAAGALVGVLGVRGRGAGSLRVSLDRLRMWRLKRRYRVISGGRDKRYLN